MDIPLGGGGGGGGVGGSITFGKCKWCTKNLCFYGLALSVSIIS